MFWHAAAAGALRTPELEIDKSEAEILGKGLLELERQFPTQIDPRLLAALNMAAAMGMVYGPRIVAIRVRLKKEAMEKRPKAPVIAPDFGFTPNTPGSN